MMKLSRQAKSMLAAMVARLRDDPAWREGCYPGRERIRTYDFAPPRASGLDSAIRNMGGDQLHPGHDRFGSPLTPDILDRLMLERRRIMDAQP